ncbi:hypothetical protein NXS19_012098 [Fusarium pseudograminearum]|nr:hypothetical protein NXS19_012098 [Fusarium pseudograminearum]
MDAFVTRLPKPQSQLRGQIRPDSLDLPTQERPSKRAKRQGSSDSDSDQSHDSRNEASPRKKFVSKKSTEDDDLDSGNPRPTDIESALPPTADGREAIEEYEAMKSSQVTAGEDDDDATEKPKPRWIKGQTSIYVDAFNLALDTVLDEESHLFDEKENDVFKQWRDLGYEAQYLYVRLFLRKAAWWHRHNRLDYHSDVSNLEAAIATLQSPRALPHDAIPPTQSPVHGIELEEYRLGGTFTFADASNEHIDSVEEAASLLSLDELKDLAKEAKIQGRNKSELTRSLVRMSKQQAGLMSVGLSRHNSRNSPSEDQENKDVKVIAKAKLRREDSNREQHFLTKILAILGPCIRLSPLAFKLFERVHLVFYRSTEWTEKSLTTIILAKIARRHFPEYIVCRTSTIFASRLHLLEYETAIRMETEVDNLEFNSPPGQEGLRMMIDVFDRVYPRWQTLVKEEQKKEHTVYEMGEGTYTETIHTGSLLYKDRSQSSPDIWKAQRASQGT